ncbi:hypothetical protein DUI87_01319 [Hirundo rustica rustica]|uniref:Uncharacterized protein n=1 Tax=Hirundo rustica rustica TaxID=333673 RepID=A0A3M0L4I5_HIRRU|nr:hypothetical protein DUI87_01319 [Hirundo rustica rustica]
MLPRALSACGHCFALPALKRRGEVGVPSTEELFRSSAWSRDSEGDPAQCPESRLECLANPYVGSRVRTCFCDIENLGFAGIFPPVNREFKLDHLRVAVAKMTTSLHLQDPLC